ncbi:MAG: hypothetical protein HOO95_00685 [Gallionella sp.]|nr:hypothetical protein [Gallionella sp.]
MRQISPVRKIITLLFSASLSFCFVAEAHASATCFCQISYQDASNTKNNPIGGFVMDLTGEVNKTYSGAFQQGEANQKDCASVCGLKSALHTPQSVAEAACAAGAPNGSLVKAWSMVGTGNGLFNKRNWRNGQTFGTLTSTPAVLQYSCPASSIDNATNQPGVNAGGGCKKLVSTCAANPSPPNGTQIGANPAWGFFWEGHVWQLLPAISTVISSKQCHF